MSAVPAHPHPLTGLPLGNVRPDRIDPSRNLVAWHARVLQSWKAPLLYEDIAVTDATCLYFDPDMEASGLWNRAFHHFEISTGSADLHCLHFLGPQEWG